MARKIVIVLMVLSLLSVTGCEELSSLTQGTTQSSSANLKIIKALELGSGWEMKQISFRLAPGDEMAILMKLSDEDEVDGYYYLEKGGDIDFIITAKELVYRSPVRSGKDDEKPDSDRFSFVASEAAGDTYTLTFRNPAGDEESSVDATIYLEVIYPVSASLYVPVADK
ncbi:MAG: emp24/gp25L/p24 family protein [Chloroflexi bacterium]|nr:emp24/gp25L/p24 family protein [Chloroflexota bacterium]